MQYTENTVVYVDTEEGSCYLKNGHAVGPLVSKMRLAADNPPDGGWGFLPGAGSWESVLVRPDAFQHLALTVFPKARIDIVGQLVDDEDGPTVN